MKSKVLRLFEYTDLSVFALLLFFIVFMGVLVWIFRKNAKSEYDLISREILVDEKEL